MLFQQLRFGVFREGVFQKMPALEGRFPKEISVRFAGENYLRTHKNTKQSSAQRFLNDPFPKTPFSAAADSVGSTKHMSRVSRVMEAFCDPTEAETKDFSGH